MNQIKKKQEHWVYRLVSRWLDRYLRTDFRSAILFLLIFLVMMTSDPSKRSFYVGVGILAVGLVLRLWARGFVENLGVAGPYRFLQRPLQLGCFLWFVGMAVIGRQVDIVLLVCVFLAWMIRADTFETSFAHTNLDPELSKIYNKFVPSLLPSLFPYDPSKMRLNVSASLSTESYSLKRGLFEATRGEGAEINNWVLTVGMLALHGMLMRFYDLFPVNWLVMALFGGYLGGRTLFFAIRGENRVASKFVQDVRVKPLS